MSIRNKAYIAGAYEHPLRLAPGQLHGKQRAGERALGTADHICTIFHQLSAGDHFGHHQTGLA